MTGYGNGTAGPSGSSKTGSTNGHVSTWSHSTVETTATLLVNWEALSEEAAWITTRIAWPISSGLSIVEVAGRLGETTAWAKARLEELQAELVQLAVALPVDESETTSRPQTTPLQH